MMLRVLVDLAERKNLLADPSYAKRSVHLQLRLSEKGRAVGLVPLGEDERGKQLAVPRPPKRTSGVAPSFVVDNAQYFLGIPKHKKGKPIQVAAIERAKRCLSAFASQLGEAAQATGDAGLAAVQAFVAAVERDPESQQALVTAMIPDHEWTGDETIAPLLDSDGATYVHERPSVRAYWANRCRVEASEGEPQCCLVTGEYAPPARLHEVIKRIPQAQSSGASLVSFNEPAFTSHEFGQGLNAPVSQRAVDGYVRALNWLLEKEGDRRFRQGVAVGADSVVVFWTRDESDAAEVLLNLLDPQAQDEEDVRATLEAAWKGLAPRDVDTTRFYALTLSGNASRVVVRDWLETTAADAKARVRKYFDDLALAGDEGPLSIGRLLSSLEAAPRGARDRRGLSPALAAGLVRAALHGTPFPRALLQTALRRMRVPPRDRDWRGTLRARVALIKAVLIRLHPDQEITMSLDETNSSVPYLLGRLFAAIEKLQADALGDVGATVRDRYFGSASATPGLVFPRLLRVSAHHASKAEAERHGWAERVKAGIIDQLPASGAFPPTLDLEAQGLFAVGYYHQRQAFFTPRKKAEDGSAA